MPRAGLNLGSEFPNWRLIAILSFDRRTGVQLKNICKYYKNPNTFNKLIMQIQVRYPNNNKYSSVRARQLNITCYYYTHHGHNKVLYAL